jgi:hypothetical protein
MVGAFFNLKGDPVLQKNSQDKGKKKKSSKNKNTPSMTSLPPHLDSFVKVLSQVADMPKVVRNAFSSRFYSFVLDSLTINSFRTRFHKASSAHKATTQTSTKNIMEDRVKTIFPLELCGLTLVARIQVKDDPEYDADMQSSKKQVQDIISMVSSQEISKSLQKASIVRGVSVLIFSLYLQLLVPKTWPSLSTSSDHKSDSDDEEDEYDDMNDNVLEYIDQLYHIFMKLLNPVRDKGAKGQTHHDEDNDEDNPSESNENPLLSLANICIGILSLFGSETNTARGAACKLMKECVKIAWGSSLSYVHSLTADDPYCSMLNEEVLHVILKAICIFHEDSYYEEDTDALSENIDDVDNDGSIFVTAANTNIDFGESYNSISHDAVDDESETFVDDTGLQKMLLDDSDVGEDDVHNLEHHAGADKALAQLILIKQQSRKAGRIWSKKRSNYPTDFVALPYWKSCFRNIH